MKIVKSLAIIMAAFFTFSCTQIQTPELNIPEDGDFNLTKTRVSYSYDNTADFFELMDAFVEYIDINGKTQVQQITSKWEYSASAPLASASSEYKFILKYSLKKDVTFSKEKYQFSQGNVYAALYRVDEAGEEYQVTPSISRQSSISQYKGSDLEQYLKEILFAKSDVVSYTYFSYSEK